MRVRGKHEIYCCGSRVTISEKGVKVLTEPTISHCPLHEALYGTKNIDKKTVQKSVETKISEHGFCCSNRDFDTEPIVAYGASEMMHVWLEKGLIDCAVVVCEGAGTVIATKGELVQAIGARLTGINKTSPIPEIIEHIEANDGLVLDKTSARIDQVAGVKRAFDMGFKRVAVSIAGFNAKAISKTRLISTDAGQDVLIFSVCNTCVHDADVKHIANADVVCASASKILREQIGRKALAQLGVTIPIYVLTEKGKKLVLAYLAESNYKLVIFRTNSLPYAVDGKGPVLRERMDTTTLKC